MKFRLLRVAAGLSVAILALLGCAGPVRPVLTAEALVIASYADAVQRLGLRGAPSLVVAPVADRQGQPGGLGAYRPGAAGQPGEVLLDPRALGSERLAEVVAAHELAHHVLGHTRATCAGEQAHRCEVAAHVASVDLLVRGWGLEERTAMLDVASWLDLATRLWKRGEAHAPAGHLDPCLEFREFSAAFGLSADCRSDLPEVGPRPR